MIKPNINEARSLAGPVRAGLLAVLLALSVPVLADESEDLERMTRFIELIQNYYATIQSVHEIASNPEKAAILQMQKIEDIYKDRGDRAEAIKILQEVMEKTKSPAIRNAASIMLGDALNETGQASEAVRVLRDALERNLGS